jgi:hypothetical protein
MSDYPAQCSFVYDRDGVFLHIKTQGMTNHEMRAILIGFWLTLDEADRRDHVVELRHYLEPGSRPPEASETIARAVREARGDA